MPCTVQGLTGGRPYMGQVAPSWDAMTRSIGNSLIDSSHWHKRWLSVPRWHRYCPSVKKAKTG
jgi:hypothetical protein